MAALAVAEPKPVTHLYVQLTGDHRVSRSFRARWLLKNLMKTVEHQQVFADLPCEINVLSALGGSLITPATEAFFVSQQYSLVFVLDMSAAMHCVSCSTYKVKLDEAVAALCFSLEQLAQPFHVPHSSVVLKPHLCVSVLGYSDIDTSKGVHLHSGNCKQLSRDVAEKVASVERQLAEVGKDTANIESFAASSSYDYGYGLGGMVTAGILGLQLLPRNAIKGLILLTDGVSGFRSPVMMHAALNQMREGNISCWVVQMGGPANPSTSFGLMPDSEALLLMTEICNGYLLDPDKMLMRCEGVVPLAGEANAVQRAVLYWTFQVSARTTNLRDLPCKDLPTFEDRFWPNIRRDFQSYTINASLSCIVGSRIREGFFLKDLIVKEPVVELHLCFLWQTCVVIEYTIITTWSNMDTNSSMLVATHYTGPYSFVHDVHCQLNPNITSSHRLAAVKKFTQTLKSFKLADTMLEHLLALPSSPGHYTLPQGVLDGMPLFYLPPSQYKPVPSMEGGGDKGGKDHALISFWCHLCSIDLTLWNKWFHSDKIILVLGPDTALPQNIQDSSASHSGRYAALLCQMATAKLYSVLKANTTFTLLEGMSYVRLLPSKESPLYFGLVRVAQKHPCVILHVGYIEGTPHSVQEQWFTSLYNALKSLHVGGGGGERPLAKRKHSVAIPLRGYICVLDKQLHKAMIRRESFNVEHSVQMDYMYHTSWNWCTPTKDSTILYAVLRRRLQEGFLITNAHNGYITVTVQLGMQQPSSPAKYCAILQYVLFPVEHSLVTELWVEPQCGIVTDVPPGLDYLQGLEYQQITDQIHKVDYDVVKTVAAFTYLWRGLSQVPLPSNGDIGGDPHISQAEPGDQVDGPGDQADGPGDQADGTYAGHQGQVEPEVDSRVRPGAQTEVKPGAQIEVKPGAQTEVKPGAQTEVQQPQSLPDSHSLADVQSLTDVQTQLETLVYTGSDVQNCEVSFMLLDLVKRSQITAFSLVAFSEDERGKEGKAMDVSMCSTLSRLLHAQVVSHIQSLAPTEVPCPDVEPLVERVSHSGVLEPFYQHCCIKEGSRYPWRCFSLNHKDSVFVFVVPSYLSRVKGIPQAIIPLLLLCCSKQMILDPDPAELDPPGQPPDAYCPFLLCGNSESGGPALMSHLGPLVPLLKDIYHSSYLHTIHTALRHRQPCAPEDFTLGMKVCGTSTVPIPCTHLIGGLCNHASLWQLGDQGVPSPVTANRLCQLLEGVTADASKWRVSLQSGNPPLGGPTHCQDWGPEVEEALGNILHEEGFRVVPSAGGYYWFIGAETEQEDSAGLDQELGVMGVGLLSPCSSPLPPVGPGVDDEDVLIDSLQRLSHRRPPSRFSLTTAPLFLHMAFKIVVDGKEDPSVFRRTVEEKLEQYTRPCNDSLPLCLKPLVTEHKHRCTVLLDTMFVSFLPQQVLLPSEEGEDGGGEVGGGGRQLETQPTHHSLLGLPAGYHRTADALKIKIEWLIMDELVAEAREVSMVTTPLIQAVVNHIQSAPPLRRCLCHRKTVRFVFEIKHCLDYFIDQIEGNLVPGYVIKRIGEFFYLLPQKPTSSASPSGSTSDIHLRGRYPSSRDDAERSKTPPITHSSTSSLTTHRRTASCGNPLAHVAAPFSGLKRPQLSVDLEAAGLEEEEYGCSRSKLPPFWLIFHFVPGEARSLDMGLFFHVRSSQNLSHDVWEQCCTLCHSVMESIDKTCHITNQWFLLKDMLDTRRCSSLLMSELPSDTWSEEAAKHMPSDDHFKPQHFQCPLVWTRHIVPHWRLKVSKAQAALNITRTVLNAFSVVNRKDVYVLQDILENGEESVFYLRIGESICQVDGDSQGLEEPVRCDQSLDGSDSKTRTDDLAGLSFSIKSTTESLETLVDSSPGKPQECLLLQLYGINTPSLALQDRLTRQIQWKLDDTTLEKLLTQYSRNQWLRLTPSDVHFLQPRNAEASHTFGITVPDWVEHHLDVLFFYFLQTLGSITIKPKYATTYQKAFFQVPRQLQDAYMAFDFPPDLEQDHMSIYIRPHVQGRGVAVICSSLMSQQGQLFVPEPRVVTPPGHLPVGGLPFCNLTKLPDVREISLELPPVGAVTLCLHIWEKGNVGISDLLKKLSTTFQQALLDLIIEMYLLPQPVAKASSGPQEGDLGPRDVALSSLQGQASSHQEGPGGVSAERGQEGGGGGVLGDRENQDQGAVEHTVSWHQIERQRRRDEEAQRKLKMAAHGHLGTLEEAYHTSLPLCFSVAHHLSSSSTSVLLYDLISCRSAHGFLAEAVLNIRETCPDAEVQGFRLSLPGHQYFHFYSEKEAREAKAAYPGYQVGGASCIIICRNPGQWEESCDPRSTETRSGQVWIDPATKQPLQLYLPLDSKKVLKGSEPPLQLVALKRNVFIPRQRLILIIMESTVVKVWMYNVSEDKAAQLKNRLKQLAEWHLTRSGFLHHVLLQKMGLFQHARAKDVQGCAKMAVKQCTSIRDAMLLVKNTAPLHNTSTTQKLQQWERQVSLEGFYMELQPAEAVHHSQDPVLDQGQQFRDMFYHQRKQYDRRDLLERVFSSWHKKRGLSSAPVLSTSISSVKKAARFLHYSTAPLLFLLSESGHQDSTASGHFSDDMKEEALKAYTEYLESLGFCPIIERPPTLADRAVPATPSKGVLGKPHTELTLPKFYKSLQKSLPGGIILVELVFQGRVLHVKMFSLEGSRLNESPVLSVEVYGLFSTECARFKDFIHLNSFMYDFHLRCLREILKGTKPFPEHLELRTFLESFLQHFQHIPSYIRNRLCKDSVNVLVSTNPTDLFQHILVHSGVYGARAQSLSSSPSSSLDEVALLIHVSPSSLGPTTSPQLHTLLQNAQQKYSVRVLALMKPSSPEGHTVTLTFYLLVVNKTELFPKLSPDATYQQPFVHFPGSGREGSDGGDGGEEGESDLHTRVKSHRKKLGLSFLSSSPSVTPVMIDEDTMAVQMKALGEHLEEIVRRAQSHLQRDALWKRLIYGKPKAEAKGQLLEALNYKEFCTLSLQLATLCPLETLDSRLSGLKKQPRKWYKKLIKPIETKFGEQVRVFMNDESSYAAIINSEWPDMFVMVQADRESHQQGIYAVYRKPQEGGVPLKERLISANVEGDRHHIETVVNFACSFLWANMVDCHFKS